MSGRRIARGAVALLQGWLALSTAYLLALLGLAAPRGGTGAPPGEPRQAVAIVPAHDEEAGIAATVASLRAQAVEIIVVADNCGDATARRAAAAGATVWERRDDAYGKGHALAWAFARLWRERPGTEVVVVVDADCEASPNLVAELDRALRAAPAAQAAYDVANPDASPAAALRWAGFALMHRVRPRGRARLGLSADLFGSGMAFRADVLRALPWRSFGVTEDAEYHLRLIEAGHRVAYAGAARVVSPMPRSHGAARTQQLRWESGNARLARTSVPRLLARGARRRDAQALHAALEQLVPPQALLAAANAAGLAAGVALRDRRTIGVAALLTSGQVAYVLGGLRVAGASPAVYRALPQAPWLVAHKLGVLARVGTGAGARTWERTEREPVTA